MNAWNLFAGSAAVDLAASVAREIGVKLGASSVERFPDGEVWVGLDESVRRRDVFIIQSTSPPVNDNLIELLAFADACRRASAASVTAVVPYFGYARQDTRHGRREPVTARMVADLIEAVGIDNLITVDLHTPQVEGFFHIPVDSLTAVSTLSKYVSERLPAGTVVVSPDAGRVKMAGEYARLLGAPVAVLHKRRESGTATKVTHLVGDVRDRPCLIIDDMISTGGTIAESIEALLEAGARPEITVAATHAVFSEGSVDKLSHKALREVVVTDTISTAAHRWSRLRVVSVAPLIASAIQRFATGGSLRNLSEQ
jgi:ribose-phosphate pyrophosphokinase